VTIPFTIILDPFQAHNIIKCKQNIINLNNSIIGLNTSNALCFNDSKTLFQISVLFLIKRLSIFNIQSLIVHKFFFYAYYNNK